MALEAEAGMMSVSVIAPGELSDHIDFDRWCAQFIQGFADGFNGTLDISLKDDVQFFDLSFLDLFSRAFSRVTLLVLEAQPPFFLWRRNTPISLAVFSSSTTANSSPAWGNTF